jgi:predicted Rossmann fold nucleotide-binding protein DprA/Smf involved in DNA uptake
MAIGIDGVAMAGAISAGKPTVAVIGSGIDVCYPSQHLRLAREIVKRGCVLTEYAPGTRPNGYNFPVRNRIISALSQATLVMEGGDRSGSLITARHAREQDKAVYAFPGNVGNDGSEASSLLIKNGAKLFTSADDILRDFEIKSRGKLDPFKLTSPAAVDMFTVLRELEVSCVAPNDDVFFASRNQKVKEEAKINEDEKKLVDHKSLEQKVLGSLGGALQALYKRIPTEGDIAVEELVNDDHPLRDVMQGLLTLEISKFVTMLPGDRVKRNI